MVRQSLRLFAIIVGLGFLYGQESFAADTWDSPADGAAVNGGDVIKFKIRLDDRWQGKLLDITLVSAELVDENKQPLPYQLFMGLDQDPVNQQSIFYNSPVAAGHYPDNFSGNKDFYIHILAGYDPGDATTEFRDLYRK